MNQNLQKWIEALRGGEFKQAQGTLFTDKGREKEDLAYCCLGVAEVLRTSDPHPLGDLPDRDLADWLGVDVSAELQEDDREWDPTFDVPFLTRDELVELLGEPGPSSDLDLFAMLSDHLEAGYRPTASGCNDEYNLTFPQIAILLETYGIKGTIHV